MIVFTVLRSNGILFGCRDYEMLSSLPVQAKEIISSKFNEKTRETMFFLRNLEDTAVTRTPSKEAMHIVYSMQTGASGGSLGVILMEQVSRLYPLSAWFRYTNYFSTQRAKLVTQRRTTPRPVFNTQR